MSNPATHDYCEEALSSVGCKPNGGSSSSSDQTSDNFRQTREGPKYRSFTNFRMDEKGLFAENKHTKKSLFISGPFEVLGRVRNPNSEGWARLLRWNDDDQRVHTFAVSDADLHGDPSTLCANLATRGLKVATERKARAALIRYLNEVSVEDRVRVVERTGWHEVNNIKVFVLPNGSIGPTANERFIVQGSATAPFESRGTLADWQNGVGSLVARYSRAVFAVSIAFVGPLLNLVGREGSGFNLYGQSSRGKTTLAEASASVWGKGDSPGFVRSWRSTANALEATAALHTDTLLVLDELSVVDPREVHAAAYQLTAGTGKGRAARDGSLRQSLSWRTMVYSTGEVRITDKLEESRQRVRSGQRVRLIDVPADAGAGFGVFDSCGVYGDAKALADAIKLAAQINYGTAGPEFVRRLLVGGGEDSAEKIATAVNVFRTKYAPKEADPQVLRVCDTFALVAVAGELARNLGVVPWTEGEALEAARRCFNDWFDSREGKEAGEVQAALAQVRLFIQQHGNSRFEPLNCPPDRPVNNRAGWRRGDGAGEEWLIPSETWKVEVTTGHDPKLVAHALAERGMLKRANDGFQRVEKIQGRSQRVYVVTARIVEAEDG
jgi:uncharacterized protein (DUF927 family)